MQEQQLQRQAKGKMTDAEWAAVKEKQALMRKNSKLYSSGKQESAAAQAKAKEMQAKIEEKLKVSVELQKKRIIQTKGAPVKAVVAESQYDLDWQAYELNYQVEVAKAKKMRDQNKVRALEAEYSRKLQAHKIKM